jgi:hypothetical protein
MTDSTKRIQDRTDAFRDTAAKVADRVDRVAAAVGDASKRLGRQLERVNEAFVEANADAEYPRQRIATAVDDLALEAKKSFRRIVEPPRGRWWNRLAFWRPR